MGFRLYIRRCFPLNPIALWPLLFAMRSHIYALLSNLAILFFYSNICLAKPGVVSQIAFLESSNSSLLRVSADSLRFCRE